MMTSAKRPVDLLVLSDIHLGTFGSHASQLLTYMQSIQPSVVVLNGDIIDIWQFNKRYWPKSHMMVIRHLIDWMAQGITVYYITGNHDEMLRRFAGFELGSLRILNQLVLTLGDEKVWFFHGDVFDVTMQHARWLTRLGAYGYDALILINKAVNAVSSGLGTGRVSLSARIKQSVKQAVKYINSFEQTAADLAVQQGYRYVVCGHIHQPGIRSMVAREGQVTYLNSGDWIENLSALEWVHGEWNLYLHPYQKEKENASRPVTTGNVSRKQLFQELMHEFNLPQRQKAL